jgi:3',5'-cyclic AMP phosphodiesterase CpdA
MPLTLHATTRRRFLGRCAAAAAGWAAFPPREARADEGESSEWIALASDAHVHADPERVRVGRNVLSNFVRVRDQVLAHPAKFQWLLINGDVAFQTGRAGDYETFLRHAQPLRDAGLSLHATLGNHDDRRELLKSFGLVEREGAQVANKRVDVVETRHVRWFLLDSLETVGATPGALGDAQIEWLDRELSRLSDKPAFVMAHHNFNYHFDVKSRAKEVVPCADRRLPAPGLADGKRLLEVLAAHECVSAYFCGHTHQWNVVDWNGIRLVNLPATGYPFRDADAIGWVACRTGPRRAELIMHALDERHKHHQLRVDVFYRGS